MRVAALTLEDRQIWARLRARPTSGTRRADTLRDACAMAHRRYRCTREIPGEYVTPGRVYRCSNWQSPAQDVRLWCEAHGAGTFMRYWQFERAVKSGALEPIA